MIRKTLAALALIGIPAVPAAHASAQTATRRPRRSSTAAATANGPAAALPERAVRRDNPMTDMIRRA
jgi:hypothetical protein